MAFHTCPKIAQVNRWTLSSVSKDTKQELAETYTERTTLQNCGIHYLLASNILNLQDSASPGNNRLSVQKSQIKSRIKSRIENEIVLYSYSGFSIIKAMSSHWGTNAISVQELLSCSCLQLPVFPERPFCTLSPHNCRQAAWQSFTL